MHILAALVLLHVGNFKFCVAAGDDAVVGDLAAHLGIERSLVEHDDALDTAHHLLGLLALDHQRDELRVVDGIVVVADKLGGRNVLTELDARPAEVAERLARLAGAGLLLGHRLGERLLVHAQPLVRRHLAREVDGEAVGVVELEGVLAGELCLALSLVLGEHIGEDLHAAVDGLGKILLLGADDLGDIALLLAQILVLALIDRHDGVDDLIEERAIHAEELAVTRRAAQQAAQDVAAALVARQHAVADHEARGADVVGDDAQGDVARVALAVVRAGDLADLVGDVHDGIDVEQGVDILADHRQTLQAHAGVDVLLLELGVVAVAVVVELGKDIVPHLNIAVAVAADRAAGLTAAVLRAAVVVNFGAGTTRTGAMLPEVILLAEAEDALLRNTDLVAPDGEGLVVRRGRLAAGEHRGVQAVRLQADPLGAGEELPRPGDRLMLEVVAEREVAEHLKVGAVARGVTDVVDVARADALLASADAAARRLLLALEPGLHGGHARVDEQDGLVVLRDQGKAGQAQVALALKEAEEHLSQLVEAVNRMGHC